MADQGFTNPQVEQLAGKNKRICFAVQLNGNTSAASIVGTTDANAGVALYTVLTSATAPTDANFSGLTNTAAPSVIGFYITDGNAKTLKGVTVPTSSIKSVSMTAGVASYRGDVADSVTGQTGVTSTGNVAFQISCTTLDMDAQTANHKFTVDVVYDAK